MSNNITGQFVIQKAGENSPQVTVAVFEYMFGVDNRALAIFEVTPNSYAVKHKGAYFADATLQKYGYEYLVNYCRESTDPEEIFTTAHKDTIPCYSGDIIHAIFVPEDNNGNYGVPAYLKITVPVAPTGNEIVKKTMTYNYFLYRTMVILLLLWITLMKMPKSIFSALQVRKYILPM